MTSPVYTVRSTDPLGKVVDVICRHGVSGVPVVKGRGRLVGLISERDILHAMCCVGDPAGEKTNAGQTEWRLKDISGLAAQDVMVDKVTTVAPDTEFLRLASIMALQKIRRIPVVEGETLVGIVSHGDVSRAIFGTSEKSAVCPAMRGKEDLP